jgi:hypothetical protein
MPQSENPFTTFGRWVINQIVQDVPEDIALCEHDCRKRQCTLGEWDRCERRLRNAAGELMPARGVVPAEEEVNKEESTEKCAVRNPC